MADLNLPLSNIGAATAQAQLDLNLGAAASKTGFNGAPVSFASLPELRGVAMANGVDPIRHCVDGSIYNTGLLPPNPNGSDISAVPAGTQATALLDFDVAGNGASIYNPSANDGLIIGTSQVWFVANKWDAVTTTKTLDIIHSVKVLIGADGAETLDNFQQMLAGTGQGTAWQTYVPFYDEAAVIRSNVEVTSHPETYQVNLNIKEYGTYGNGIAAYFYDGSWTDCALGSATDADVGTAYYFGGGTDTGSGPAAGSYRYFYTYYRSTDLAESGQSETATASLGESQQVNIGSMIAGDDADYDFKRLYRTLKSGVEFFRVADVAAATTSYNDTSADSAITLFGSIPYDIDAHRGYYGGHIPKYRVLASWKGRLWGAGARLSATYTLGTADLDPAESQDVVITSGVPTEDWVGRRFRATADAETYRIIKVTESSATIRLDRPYQGSADGTAAYEVVDDRDPTNIGCSEPGLPNQWPGSNQLTGIRSNDPEGIVGIVAYGDSLFFFCRDGIWRLTGESITSWQLTKVVDGIGAVHQPVSIPNGMVWVGVDGIYAWAGSGEPSRISSPPQASGEPTGIDGTISRINWPHAHLTHALYDPEDRTVRFFVPLDSAVSPSHAITLDISTQGTFGLDDARGMTASCLVVDENGDHVPLVGNIHGHLFQFGMETDSFTEYHFASAKDQGALAIPTKDAVEGSFASSTNRTRFRVQKRGSLHKLKLSAFVGGDGLWGVEPVQAISSATIRTVTVGGSIYSTDQCKGCPAWIVDADGTRELGIVISNTADTLTFVNDLSSAPTSADQIVVGGIYADYESGRFDLGETRRSKSVYDVWVTHSPGAPALLGFDMGVRVPADQDS